MTEEVKPNQPTPSTGIGIGVPPVTVNLSMPNNPPAQATVAPAPSYKAIVTTDSCAICAGLKQYLEKKGLTDKVKIINASTPEGRKFADEHGIKGVPECLVVEDGGKVTRICTSEEFKKLLTDGE